ncbi:MAG: YeaH/YhbH family protein [Rhodobacteraceae bacterium]|nr:YeaH/YhbH family protein [Paracoccaceae bacterium]
MHIIDRRLNPKSKSLGNRQRFIRRAKADIREAVQDALRKRKVSDVEGQENIRIRAKTVREPSFSHGAEQGRRRYVLPGNEQYQVGDVIPKPPSGAGGGGADGSPDGDGEDDFVFTLSKDEFLEVFFEDLELPNLEKRKLMSLKSPTPVRAGFSTEGSPSKLSYARTMRNSLARRIALRRPKDEDMREMEAALFQAEAARDEPKAAALRIKLQELRERRRVVAYIDPIDLRYRRFEPKPTPTTQAVMFCLMDASASMTEQLKDLAKRFFMLLYVFLSRHYKEIDLVFIRHTSVAAEVDEDTFFRGVQTGGTVVSSALLEMQRVIAERYPVDEWNIYAAQASDGHNFSDDMSRCLQLLNEELIPICQYFAYIEVTEREFARSRFASQLWSGYLGLEGLHDNFAMRRVSSAGEIFPVFHDLFARSNAAA